MRLKKYSPLYSLVLMTPLMATDLRVEPETQNQIVVDAESTLWNDTVFDGLGYSLKDGAGYIINTNQPLTGLNNTFDIQLIHRADQRSSLQINSAANVAIRPDFEIQTIDETLIFNPSSSTLTLDGTITGQGLFRKIGDGQLVLTADLSQFTGQLYIDQPSALANTAAFESTLSSSVFKAFLQLGPNTRADFAGPIQSPLIVLENNSSLFLKPSSDIQLSSNLTGSGLIQIQAANPNAEVLLTGYNNLSSYIGLLSGQIGLTPNSARSAVRAAPGTQVNFYAGPSLISGIYSSEGSFSFGAGLSGGGQMHKYGSETLFLNSSTLSGGLTIHEGRLVLNDQSFYGNIMAEAGTELVLELQNAKQYTATVAGLGHLIKAGQGVLTVDPAASLSYRRMHVQEGSLSLQSQQITSSNIIEIWNDADLRLQADVDTTFDKSLSGSGTFEKAGNAQLRLTGPVDHDGPITISAGRLILGPSSNVGSISNNAELEFDIPAAASLENHSALTGSGSLIKSGAGALILDHSVQAYSGGTIISAGSLETYAPVAAGDYAINAGSLLSYNISGGPVTVTGSVSGAGDWAKLGPDALILQGNNSLTGHFFIREFEVRQAQANTLNNAVSLNIGASGLFNLNNFDAEVGSLEGSGTISLGSGSLTVGANNRATTFSGTMSGTGGLIKKGLQTLTLSSIQTYSGPTRIELGSLIQGRDNVLSPLSALILQTNTTFNTGNFQAVANTVEGSGILAIGNGRFDYMGIDTTAKTFSGTITGGAASVLNKYGTGQWTLSSQSSFNGSTFIQAGTLQYGIAQALPSSSTLFINTLATLDLNSYSSTFKKITGTGNILLGSTGSITFDSDGLDFVFDGQIKQGSAGQNSVIKQGLGQITLTGQNDYLGQTLIQGGSLRIGADNALPVTTRLNINSPTAAFYTGSFNQQIAGLSGLGLVDIESAASTTGGSLTINGSSSDEFYGQIRGNALSSLNIFGTSKLIFQNPADIKDYRGKIFLASTATVEFRNQFIAAESAHTALGHIRGAGTTVIYSDRDLTTAQAEPFNIVVGGTGKLQLTGTGSTGQIVISAPQIYTGNTEILKGRLNYGVNNALPSSTVAQISSGAVLDLRSYSGSLAGINGLGSINLDSGSALTLNTPSHQTFSGTIDGASSTSVLKAGSGYLTLDSSSMSQNISSFLISQGGLTLQGTMSHSLRASGTAEYILDTTGSHYLNGALSADHSGEDLRFAGSSSMTWKGRLFVENNATIGRSSSLSDSPSINIQGGQLILDNTNAQYTFNQTTMLGSTALHINPGFNFTIDVTDALSRLSSNLVFDQAGHLIKTGSGELLLTSPQLYTGNTTISAGSLTLSEGVQLATSSLLNNGLLNITGTSSTQRSFNFPITGTGGLTIDAPVLSPQKLLFSGLWDYRGATTLTRGYVEHTGSLVLMNNSYTIAPAATWSLNAATASLRAQSSLEGMVYIAGNTTINTTGALGTDLGNSSNIYVAQIAPTVKWSATNSAPTTQMNLQTGSTLTLNANTRSLELEMDISGAGSLVKTGSYRAVLSPKNAVNYTGSTTVNAGTLVVDNKFSKDATSRAQVNAGATLAFRNLRSVAEDRDYANPNSQPTDPSAFYSARLNYTIQQYLNPSSVPSNIPAPTGLATDNYIEYSFPISGAGSVRIERPAIAKNAVYLSGDLSYTGTTTVAEDAFLYVNESFKATGDLKLDGTMHFYTPDLGETNFHYLTNNVTGGENGRIEKYGPGNLVLAGEFQAFQGVISIQGGKLFFTTLPANRIENIGLVNLLARGGSILTLTAGPDPYEFSGTVIGESNTRYRLTANMNDGLLTVASLQLDGRIDLRQTFNGVNDPRNIDDPTTGIPATLLAQAQFQINELVVAPKSQFYFQFDQAYDGWAGVDQNDPSLRAFAKLNFQNDSIAQYILQGYNDSDLFEDYRYRLLVFENTVANNRKVDEIMTLLRAPTIYVVEAQKVIDSDENKIYLDVVITKRDTAKILDETSASVAPATVGLARQLQRRAISTNLFERNANKVLENAEDPDDLINQVKYFTPTGNKKEKEQAEPTANADAGSMAQQTVLNFRQNILSKKYLQHHNKLNYKQRSFAEELFSSRHHYDARKQFNKKLSGHYEQQNFSWAEVFDELDLFGLSTSLESSYSHVVTRDSVNEPGSAISTWSSTFGVSQVLQDKYIIGVLASYSDRRITLKPNVDIKTSVVDEKIRNLGFFAAYQDMDVPYYWSTFLSFGNHDYDAVRTWNHPRYDDNRAINEYIPSKAWSTHDGYDISGNIELGYTFTLSQEIALQPYVGAGFTRLHEPAYSEESIETDRGTETQYGNIMLPNLTKMHSRSIGIQGIQSFAVDNTAYQVSSRLSYVMTKNDGDERVFRYSYLYAPETVNEIVSENERYHAFEMMLGFNMAYDYQWILSLNYTGSFGNRVTAHSIVGTVQYTFW